jgi:topoisomerase IA-like protein
MAERMMLVCDTCGRPAAETVTFKTSRGNRQRDYCTQHLDELLGASRAPKRGRRPGATGASAAGKTKTSKKTTAKRTAKKSTTTRKRRVSKR